MRPTATLLLLILHSPFTIAATEAAPEWRLAEFHCELPAFKPSGDSSNELRQLQKIEKRFERCIKRFRTELNSQKSELLNLRQQAKGEQLEAIDHALDLIEQGLSYDFKTRSNVPAPDRRDFFDLQHGG